MQLSKITSQRETLAIPFGDEKLNIVYKPQAVTLELVDRKEQAMINPGETLARLLVDLVESWDLVDDAGQVYPLELAAVRLLPIDFVNAILEMILKESRLNPTKANSLPGGSQPAGSLATRQNGIR
jgi:hypothetical protein